MVARNHSNVGLKCPACTNELPYEFQEKFQDIYLDERLIDFPLKSTEEMLTCPVCESNLIGKFGYHPIGKLLHPIDHFTFRFTKSWRVHYLLLSLIGIVLFFVTPWLIYNYYIHKNITWVPWDLLIGGTADTLVLVFFSYAYRKLKYVAGSYIRKIPSSQEQTLFNKCIRIGFSVEWFLVILCIFTVIHFHNMVVLSWWQDIPAFYGTVILSTYITQFLVCLVCTLVMLSRISPPSLRSIYEDLQQFRDLLSRIIFIILIYWMVAQFTYWYFYLRTINEQVFSLIRSGNLAAIILWMLPLFTVFIFLVVLVALFGTAIKHIKNENLMRIRKEIQFNPSEKNFYIERSIIQYPGIDNTMILQLFISFIIIMKPIIETMILTIFGL